MLDFTQYFATRLRRLITPQRHPIPDSTQVPDSAVVSPGPCTSGRDWTGS